MKYIYTVFLLGICMRASSAQDKQTNQAPGDKEMNAIIRVKEIGKIPFARDATNFTFDLAFAADGSKIVASADKETLRAWEIATGKVFWSIDKKIGSVTDLVISPNGKSGFCMNSQRLVSIFDVDSGDVISKIDIDFSFSKLAIHTDGKTLVVYNSGQLVFFTIPANGKPYRSKTEKWPFKGDFRSDGIVAISPDLKQMATRHATRPDSVNVWDIGKKAVIHQMPAKDESGSLMARFSPCGKYLVVFFGLQGTRIWNVEKGTELKFLDYKDRVTNIAISANSQWLATTSARGKEKGGEIVIWDLKTGTKLHQLNHRAYCLAFSPKGNMLAARCDDSIRIWTISETEPKKAVPKE